MKKYLMMGVSALAMGAVFTACSNDEGATAEEYYQAVYDQAFEKAFGKVSPNQNWGFGPQGTTRAENANANEWADPNKAYGGLLVPPALTEAQIAVVKKYFQTVKNPTYQDPHWTNYFMQQVYKGYTDPLEGEGYSPEAYLAADGNTYIKASDNMDHLAAIDGDFVDHINNFNHGDCSVNDNVLSNGGNANNGPFHSDKIMYMKESTTKSFGYYNSNGSVRRTEYTGLVNFQTIIDVLGAEANCLNDGWNRSFMGFDFEQMVGPEIYVKGVSRPDENGNWQWYADEYDVFEWKGQQYPVLISNQNMYCGVPLECNDADLQKDGYVDNLLAQGYLPVAGGANKKWVKVGGCADGYYSDWIVCLTEAKTNVVDPTTKSIRIMAEDLSATEASDFDFNDVVFDVEADFSSSNSVSQVKLTLWAAGGTLPLRLNRDDNLEVHRLLQVANIPTMTNTHAQRFADNKQWFAEDNKTAWSQTVTLANGANISKDNFEADVNQYVLVEVKKEGGQWVVLTANEGKAACKIGCPIGTPWALERHNMDKAFTSFKNWVNNATPTNWYSSKVDAQLYNEGTSVIYRDR